MTCKPIYVFLEENGVAPTLQNKKRWQAGWTISELKEGSEFIMENYRDSVEKQFGRNFFSVKEKTKMNYNETLIQKAIVKEKKRRAKIEQFTGNKKGLQG